VITATDNGRILTSLKTNHTLIVIHHALNKRMLGRRLMREILSKGLEGNTKSLKEVRNML
jgi:hypothetical protein